jgi:hypothetical protein
MHFLQGLRQPANRRLAHSMEDGRQTPGLVQGVPNRRGEWIPMDGLPTCPSPKWHLEVRHHFVPIYSSVTIYRHLPSPSANPRIGDQSTVYLGARSASSAAARTPITGHLPRTLDEGDSDPVAAYLNAAISRANRPAGSRSARRPSPALRRAS